MEFGPPRPSVRLVRSLKPFLPRSEIMRSHWILGVLLSSALVVGCGDRNADNPQNLEENATPGTTGQVYNQPPAAESAPTRREDSSAAPRRTARPAPADAD